MQRSVTGAVPGVGVAARRACQFFCVWGLEVGGDSVGVGGGELGEGLFPVGGGVSLDEAGVSCSFVGGFASVCEALGGSFVFDVADGEPRAFALRRGYSACPASRATVVQAAVAMTRGFAGPSPQSRYWPAALRLARSRAWASTSSGVSGPCVEPALPSDRRHAMVRPSRAPNRAR